MEKIKKFLPFKIIKDSVFLHCTGFTLGIGCFFDSAKAIDKIVKIKKRDNTNFIILVSCIEELLEYVEKLDREHFELIEDCKKDNVTFLIKSNSKVPDYLKKNGISAFRIVADRNLKMLISQHDKPAISTSVNISNQKPLTDFNEIEQKFGEKIDYYLGEGVKRCENIGHSTIVKYDAGRVILIREGSEPFRKVIYKFRKIMKLKNK